MLRELSIVNFAIIDDLKISFPDGLSILSGETGAGKSIIINAANLLLGMRATARLIRTGADQAELEALFQVPAGSRAAEIMEAQGYDVSESLLIKRIITRNERHRIYLNGRLATTQLLASATEYLASISGQHAHQGLLKEDENLRILDQFGGLLPLRAKIYRCYYEILPLIENLKKLETGRDRHSEHRELLRFQKKEIDEANISPGEDSTLEAERMRLKNAEALFEDIHGAFQELYDADAAIVGRLASIKKLLEKAAAIDPELDPKIEQIADVGYRLTDLADELRVYRDNVRIDERRLEAVEERLDTLRRLKRKYGGSLEAVASHLETIDRELTETENISEKIAEIEAGLARRHTGITELSRELSARRRKAAKTLAEKVESELASLHMSSTTFAVDLWTTPADERSSVFLTDNGLAIQETGLDRALFMIAPNVGEPLKPLASIASGGELSRVVLALKAILAETDSVETVVFDEVDAGIGGGVAEVVGKKLASLARHHQIICITHHPQIAKFGDHHFRISKHVEGGRTRTTINHLSRDERIQEIARMLGGVKITRATLAHAQEMLGSP